MVLAQAQQAGKINPNLDYPPGVRCFKIKYLIIVNARAVVKLKEISCALYF